MTSLGRPEMMLPPLNVKELTRVQFSALPMPWILKMILSPGIPAWARPQPLRARCSSPGPITRITKTALRSSRSPRATGRRPVQPRQIHRSIMLAVYPRPILIRSGSERTIRTATQIIPTRPPGSPARTSRSISRILGPNTTGTAANISPRARSRSICSMQKHRVIRHARYAIRQRAIDEGDGPKTAARDLLI